MFDFSGKRGWFFLISILILIPGLISLAIPPRLKPGIDFSSGATFTVDFKADPEVATLRAALSEFGYHDSRVQRTTGGEFIVRTAGLDEASASPDQQSPRAKLEEDLRGRFGPMVDSDGAETGPEGRPAGFQDFSSVSEAVSLDIARNAAFAVAIAAVAILIYISWAFRHVPRPFRYGVAAVVALAHDALLVLGVFSIFGKVFNMEVNAMFITGVLTVIGFSVHDTIVVFDRVRENIATHPGIRLEQAVNISLTDTLSRSINTSLTVVITVVALLLLGGDGIRSFLLVLLIGIVAGTYSSIAVATQILVAWENGDFGRLLRWLRIRKTVPGEA